jgi:cytochrome P450
LTAVVLRRFAAEAQASHDLVHVAPLGRAPGLKDTAMIDLLDPATFSAGHPAEVYARLRAHAPVYWNPEAGGGGFWALTRHREVTAVDRDFATFSSRPTTMIADPPPGEASPLGEAQMMLMMDPPRHTAFRKLIRAQFTRSVSESRIPWLQGLARRIVDAVIERGTCDFVADVAGEMPSLVIADLMGLPPEDGRELYRLTEAIHAAPQAAGELSAREALVRMFAYGLDLIARKRAHPAEDLASRLLAADVEGRKLTDPEFLLYFLLLVDAGGDTTRNLLGGGMLALCRNPAQLAWLLADLPGRLPGAREELLRYLSPVIYMRRTASRATSIDGVAIAAGDKVVMYFGAANRDPDRFTAPDELDLARVGDAHIAFGGGPHVCLGQHLARLEIDAVLFETLRRMRDIEIVEDPDWLVSTFISGPRALKIRFRPGAPARF